MIVSTLGRIGRRCRPLFAAGLALLTGVASAHGQTVASPPAAANAAASSSWTFQAGVDERVRYEGWNDLVDHSDGVDDRRAQLRFRTRLWLGGQLWDGVAFRVTLDNESKAQRQPETPLTMDETVFEGLWLTWTPNRLVSVKVGRQDINKAEGFIWRDGTPGDGARTDYVNAVDASITIAPRAVLEIIAATDPSYDTYLPVIHDQHRRLIEWDERLAGVYYTDRRHEGLDLEAYYFFKREANDKRPTTHPQFQPNRDINTLGLHARLAHGPAWSVWTDVAGQAGTQAPNTAIRAWAIAGGVQRRVSAPWTPVLRASYTALSGDTKATSTIEGWDPLVSRWPLYSDALVLTLGPEIGNGYWSNMGLLKAEAAVTPTPQLGLRATYYKLSAFHPFAGSPDIFSNGTDRGDLFQARFDAMLNSRLRGYVLYEHLLPGNFYTHRDPGYLFRVEVTASWQGRLGG